jgi:hypothetical protein
MGCKTTTTNKFNSTCFIRKRCKVVKLLNTYVGAVSMKSYRKRQRERGQRKEREERKRKEERERRVKFSYQLKSTEYSSIALNTGA